MNTPAHRIKPTSHPDGDERYKAIDRSLKLFRYEKDSLLEVLNSAQEAFGYLSPEVMVYISGHLGVPLSRVYGVATFYHMFTFEPLGKHNCIVCTGTACHVKGSDQIVAALEEEFQVKAGSTTEDGLFSLTIARCLGSCGLAPVTVLDGEVSGKQTPEGVIARVREIIAESKREAQEQQPA